MTIEDACARIIGRDLAQAIIRSQGINWCVVAAMAEARTSDDPTALYTIRQWNKAQQARALQPDTGERT